MHTNIMHIGEIIDVSTTRFTAQCVDRKNPPHFGSFIKAAGTIAGEQHASIYGIVFNVHETSIDPSRRPVAHGLTPEELHKQYPHFEEYLKVELEAAVIGFGNSTAAKAISNNFGTHTYLPPFPPRIHSFVYACDAAEILSLTDDLEFIRTLNALNGLPVEELIAAAIRNAYAERNNDRSFLIRAGQEIAKLLKDDYEKARGILRRIDNGR